MENLTEYFTPLNFTTLGNSDLLKLIKEKSKQERLLTLEVIVLIKEIEKRRLFLDMGFGSLFDFVTKELGYEESAANRRISASRLIRDFPDAEQKIRGGNLTLTNIVQAQVFFRKEEKIQSKRLTREEKKEVLVLLENKSSRDAKKALLGLSPKQATLKESTRQVTPQHTEIKVIIDEGVRSKLEKLKSLLSHKRSHMSYAELIDELATMALKRLDPVKRIRVQEPELPPAPAEIDKVIEPKHAKAKRYIPVSVRGAVWERDQGKCVFTNPHTGRMCGSKFQLEPHHEIPFAIGGQSTIENLRLYCKRHNVYRSLQDFGTEKMKEFIPGSIPI